MARLEYSGINPTSIEFINSDEFSAVLASHPNLRLVTTGEEDEDDNELLVDVTLPLPDGFYGCIAIMDADAFMWVLNDSYCIINNPSAAFIEVLKAMDVFSVKTLKQRLFSLEGSQTWLYMDSAEVLAAEFDFANGEYIL